MTIFMLTATGIQGTGIGAAARIASAITTGPGMIMTATTATGTTVIVAMIANTGTDVDMAEAADTTEIETN